MPPHLHRRSPLRQCMSPPGRILLLPPHHPPPRGKTPASAAPPGPVRPTPPRRPLRHPVLHRRGPAPHRKATKSTPNAPASSSTASRSPASTCPAPPHPAATPRAAVTTDAAAMQKTPPKPRWSKRLSSIPNSAPSRPRAEVVEEEEEEAPRRNGEAPPQAETLATREDGVDVERAASKAESDALATTHPALEHAGETPQDPRHADAILPTLQAARTRNALRQITPTAPSLSQSELQPENQPES